MCHSVRNGRRGARPFHEKRPTKCLSVCAAVPAVLAAAVAAQDRARHGASVRADAGAQRPGPLSPARSQAILQGLERGAEKTNIFDRHLALEQQVSESPLLTGNRVRLLEDGPDTYRAMFAAILAARDHINIETYILEDDEVGQRFAGGPDRKAAAGSAGEPDLRQRGHAGYARRVLPAPAGQRHPHAGVQPVDPRRRKRAGT